MKRITYLAAIVVGVLAWAAPAQAASESFTGSVKAVSGSSITVERGTVSSRVHCERGHAPESQRSDREDQRRPVPQASPA